MAQQQTAYAGDSIKVLVNVIGSSGSHEAATIDISSTRLSGYSTVPTVNTIATGIYEVVFASVTPAPAEGDRLVAKINGTVTSTSTAWSEFGIPVLIVADERGTDNASTFDASTDTVTTDAASRTASQADVSSLATSAALSGVESKIDTVDANVDSILVDTGTDIPASIAALNDFDPATQEVTTDAASRNASKADVSSLATAASIAALNDISSAGAGGSGLYQVTVNVQNQSAQALQGARINVDGTTLTLVTDSSGQCVFNLDSGVYTLHVSPPAGYQTPTGNVITISAADISSTFTLEATAPSGDCDVPWVG